MSRLLALFLAMAGTACALLLPLYEVNVTRTVGTTNVTERYRARVIDGKSVTPAIAGCSLCVVLSAAALVTRRLQTAAGIVVLAYSLLGLMTIGMFFLPSASALLYPAIRRRLG